MTSIGQLKPFAPGASSKMVGIVDVMHNVLVPDLGCIRWQAGFSRSRVLGYEQAFSRVSLFRAKGSRALVIVPLFRVSVEKGSWDCLTLLPEGSPTSMVVAAFGLG